MFTRNDPMADAARSAIKVVALCAAMVLGAASTALAMGSEGRSAAVQRCLPDTHARSFGSGDPDSTRMSEYAMMVAHCVDDYYQLHRRLP